MSIFYFRNSDGLCLTSYLIMDGYHNIIFNFKSTLPKKSHQVICVFEKVRHKIKAKKKRSTPFKRPSIAWCG
jgi:hypothetical protein